MQRLYRPTGKPENGGHRYHLGGIVKGTGYVIINHHILDCKKNVGGPLSNVHIIFHDLQTMKMKKKNSGQYSP